MTTYQIRVEYLGTNFVGWQFQKNGLSIQEVLETALSKYLKENINIIFIKVLVRLYLNCEYSPKVHFQ